MHRPVVAAGCINHIVTRKIHPAHGPVRVGSLSTLLEEVGSADNGIILRSMLLR